jgi:putative FmdB family regulatory protein
MPTYEYACDSCNNRFEVFQKMSEAPVDSCPECGKKVRRVLSGGIGVSFKGSGFYVTDSKASSAPSTKTGAMATQKSASGSSTGSGS